jgi:hypothetical protein
MTLGITSSSDTPIRPKDIDSDATFIGLFGGQRETEVVAYWIIRYCQAKRSWRPFTYESLLAYCLAHTEDAAKRYLMAGVVGLHADKAVLIDANVLTLTTRFVAQCYSIAPLRGMPRRKRTRKVLQEVYLKSCLDQILEDDDVI